MTTHREVGKRSEVIASLQSCQSEAFEQDGTKWSDVWKDCTLPFRQYVSKCGKEQWVLFRNLKRAVCQRA